MEVLRMQIMVDEMRGKRIMVVDDEDDLILFYGMSLEYYDLKLKHSMIQEEHYQVLSQIIMI
jgi:hypothetical protein